MGDVLHVRCPHHCGDLRPQGPEDSAVPLVTGSLVDALVRCQQSFPPIPKTHTNPAFKSKYADLGDVLAAVRPVLSTEGIAVLQPMRITDTGCELVTVLLRGDERIESAIPLQVDGKAQDLGSRLTYLRRYALCSLLGVVAEDDDDGNAASAQPRRAQRAPRVDPNLHKAHGGLPPERLKAVTDWFDGLPDDVRKERKRAFVAEFGAPADADGARWAEMETFMAGAP